LEIGDTAFGVIIIVSMLNAVFYAYRRYPTYLITKALKTCPRIGFDGRIMKFTVRSGISKVTLSYLSNRISKRRPYPLRLRTNQNQTNYTDHKCSYNLVESCNCGTELKIQKHALFHFLLEYFYKYSRLHS
jgi:hypothetical protein